MAGNMLQPLAAKAEDVPVWTVTGSSQAVQSGALPPPGIAGLVAGYELRRQGHDVVILEAQGRVGGRVYTLRDFAPGLYAEAGAMRFPRVHDLALTYCEKFGLELRAVG